MRDRKWEPLGHYAYADTDYVVFAKRVKSGLVKFKTVRVHGFFKDKNRVFPHDSIDPKTQWEKIINPEAI